MSSKIKGSKVKAINVTEKNPQIAAIDMDDTLLRSDKTISRQTLETIEQWQAAGRRIIIATGRPPRRISDTLPEALHHLPWVAYNGATAADAGEVILEDYMSVDDTRHILELLSETLPHVTLGLEIEDDIYFNRPVETDFGQVIEDLLSIADRPAAKILFMLDDFAPLRALEPRLPENSRVLLSAKYQLVQIMSATADKAHALQYLVERWGCTMDDVVAFGDDVNDVGMVQASGLGIAVENAVPEVIAVADQMTNSNNADGVAHAMRALMVHSTTSAKT